MVKNIDKEIIKSYVYKETKWNLLAILKDDIGEMPKESKGYSSYNLAESEGRGAIS